MPSSPAQGPNYTRRALWLSGVIVVAGLIYTGIWYYLAGELNERVAAALLHANQNGVRANCEEPEIHGYPFRLGVRCRSVFYEDVKEGVSFRAEAAETAANIYNPQHVVVKVESPVTLMLPFLPQLNLRWKELGLSAQLDRPLPSRVSIAGSNIQLFPDDAEDGPVAQMSAGELHARQVEQDLELATTFHDLVITDGVAPNIPALEGRAMVLVNDGVSMLENRNLDLRGHKGQIEEMVIGVVGKKAAISLSGPMEVDRAGYLTGQLRIKVDDPVGTARILADVFPSAADPIRSATGMLTALGNATVELRIVRGNVFLGFIPLGTIPPI